MLLLFRPNKITYQISYKSFFVKINLPFSKFTKNKYIFLTRPLPTEPKADTAIMVVVAEMAHSVEVPILLDSQVPQSAEAVASGVPRMGVRNEIFHPSNFQRTRTIQTFKLLTVLARKVHVFLSNIFFVLI